MKASDPRLNFYPVFAEERSMVQESTISEMCNLSKRIHRLRKSIKARHGVEPHSLGRRQRDRKRWETMSRKMRAKLKELGIPPPRN